MWKVLAFACVLAACGKSEREKQQEQFDRAIERAGGIERDEHGRPYKVTPGERARARTSARPTQEYEPLSPQDAKAQCEQKKQSACGEYALYMAMGVGGIPEDRKKAEQLVRGPCETTGEGNSCHALGYLYETGIDGKRDQVKAMELYEKACTAKAPDACGELGLVYFNGNRSPTGGDPEKAVMYLTKACELGDRMSCHQIGIVKGCIANPDAGGLCRGMAKKKS